MIATFMPKPFASKTGSGLHLHISLTTDGTPVFPVAEGVEDPKGLGLSPTAYSFVAGILEHAGALQGVIAPTVNSYKRTGAVTTASGASWAPRTPTYGGNDRTHYVRVPDADRVELRGGDGAANPYLAIAGALACGLDGVERGLDPGAVGTGPDAVLPPTLVHAIDALEADPVLTGMLDAALTDGVPSVAAYFTRLKREEFFSWHSAVGSWEHDRYLTAF